MPPSERTMIIPPRAKSKIDALPSNGTKAGTSILFLWPVCHDSPFSKSFAAPLQGTGTRNIPRHLVMILPNNGSLRL